MTHLTAEREQLRMFGKSFKKIYLQSEQYAI